MSSVSRFGGPAARPGSDPGDVRFPDRSGNSANTKKHAPKIHPRPEGCGAAASKCSFSENPAWVEPVFAGVWSFGSANSAIGGGGEKEDAKAGMVQTAQMLKAQKNGW
jgi:hypothetical protein